MANNVDIVERFSLLCDDVRSELGNKVSLMGVYGDVVQVPKFPATLSRIVVAKRFDGTLSSQAKGSLDILGPNRLSLLKAGKLSLEDIGFSGQSNIVVGVGPITFEHAGEYTFRLELMDGAKTGTFDHLVTFGERPR